MALAAARPPAWSSSRIRLLGMRAVPFALTLVAWWAATTPWGGLPRYVLPSPGTVLGDAVDLAQRGVLLDAVVSSVTRMVVGFLLGAALGIAGGMLVGTNRAVSAFFMPLARFFQAIAGVIWIPLAVLWLGISWRSVTFIIFNTVFFLVFYNTLMGVQTVPRALRASILTLGGSRWDIVREVLLPGALPSILVGMRVGVGYGWRSLIAAEIIASGQGLGVLIWQGERFFRIPDIIVGLLLIGLISLAMDRLVFAPLQARTVERWGTTAAAPR
jgi:NitT/TauT family transport system permease protein/taurine transport system permease protein